MKTLLLFAVFISLACWCSAESDPFEDSFSPSTSCNGSFCVIQPTYGVKVITYSSARPKPGEYILRMELIEKGEVIGKIEHEMIIE